MRFLAFLIGAFSHSHLRFLMFSSWVIFRADLTVAKLSFHLPVQVRLGLRGYPVSKIQNLNHRDSPFNEILGNDATL
ncbi:hypothetical protein DFH11DRAFT_1618447 [Phellopilus nigrolimitatus]|nr:hypothetical protein DFH11DRAFT_1618447 [Phellopilus nigrolimitatus]